MKLLILGRDGVINESHADGVSSPEQFQPIPGSLEAIGRLTRAGYVIVLITYQPGVARGDFSLDMLNRIHVMMIDRLREYGGQIEAIFLCTHAESEQCACRRPASGLLEEIAQRFNTQLAAVFAVGDGFEDVMAAQKVGARPALVRTGGGEAALALPAPELDGVPVFDDLASFAEQLLNGVLE